MNNIGKIKSHFENEAKEFDELILKLIPFYNEMLDALVLSIPFSKERPIRVADLGCGTGTISKRIKKNFDYSKITCLDLAENMIRLAEKKLEKYDDIRYCTGNFYDYEFDGKFDVIVSSLALHHLISDQDKKSFYKKIFNALAEKGVFYNADVVQGSNDHMQKVFMEKWKNFMVNNVGLEAVENVWIPKHKEEDRPAQLMAQIKWLEEIGFKKVDVIWKYYNFAVYGGWK